MNISSPANQAEHLFAVLRQLSSTMLVRLEVIAISVLLDRSHRARL